MKHLRLYENFNKSEIEELCNKFNIKNFHINENGSIDVNGDVILTNKIPQPNFSRSINHQRHGLDKIPIKFNIVNGNFYCDNNKLTTLENSPRKINSRNDKNSMAIGTFNCAGNELTTLIGGPLQVRSHYDFSNNNLKDVYGFPDIFDELNFIIIDDNPVCEILSMVEDDGKRFTEAKTMCKFIYWLNEYKVIRNGNSIVQDRLEEALENVGFKLPEGIKFKEYKII